MVRTYHIQVRIRHMLGCTYLLISYGTDINANARTGGGGYTGKSILSLGASGMQPSAMTSTTPLGFTSAPNMNATAGHGPGQVPMTYVPYRPMPTKLQREVQASARLPQPQRPDQTSSPVSNVPSEATGSSTATFGSEHRLIVHEDSGMRLLQRGDSEGVVEVPPRYTPG